MKFFDVFTLKKDIEYLKENSDFDDLSAHIGTEVKTYMKDTVKTGKEKREAVLKSTALYINKFISSQNSVIGKALLILAPHLIQGVYNVFKVDKTNNV